jgi:hypothetical protein
MNAYYPELILVQEQSLQDSATREILERLRGIETRIISSTDVSIYDNRTLVLVHHPGRFLKNCQGSGAEICCGYLIASYAWNCHLECTYCVLRSYLGSEAILVCTNIEEMLHELKETSHLQSRDRRVGRFSRFGPYHLLFAEISAPFCFSAERYFGAENKIASD